MKVDGKPKRPLERIIFAEENRQQLFFSMASSSFYLFFVSFISPRFEVLGLLLACLRGNDVHPDEEEEGETTFFSPLLSRKVLQ